MQKIQALCRVIISEFIAVFLLTYCFILLFAWIDGDFSREFNRRLFFPLGTLSLTGLTLAFKFLFGYYCVLLFMFFFIFENLQKMTRAGVGAVHFVIAGFCLLVSFGGNAMLNGSMMAAFTETWRITAGVGIAWISTFAAVFIPGISAAMLPRFLQIRWFFAGTKSH